MLYQVENVTVPSRWSCCNYNHGPPSNLRSSRMPVSKHTTTQVRCRWFLYYENTELYSTKRQNSHAGVETDPGLHSLNRSNGAGNISLS